MKIRIELDSSIAEDEVVIRCAELTEEVQRALADVVAEKQRFVVYRGDTEYYLPMEDILFFETEDKVICAHTSENVYQVRHRLYELEEFLPGYFMRVSKSTILNSNKIYAIHRNLTASSLVEFQGSHKQVFVSRYYYKPLKNKLEEKRNDR